jgi:membrane fusion protein (multidrug efflux system)
MLFACIIVRAVPRRETVQIYANGAWRDAALVVREDLRPGDVLRGPAIIDEKNATTVLVPGWQARVSALDHLVLERYQDKVALRQTVDVQVDAIPGHSFQARIEAIDPLIDANGRSISLRAVMGNSGVAGKAKTAANPGPVVRPGKAVAAVSAGNVVLQSAEEVCPAAQMPATSGGASNGPLRPGMFARVNALFALKQAALSIPEEAIVPMGGKQFVIKAVPPDAVPEHGPLPPDTKLVSQRTEVKLGARRPGRVEILSGLTATDTVVVAGQFRLQKDGTALRVIETRN